MPQKPITGEVGPPEPDAPTRDELNRRRNREFVPNDPAPPTQPNFTGDHRTPTTGYDDTDLPQGMDIAFTSKVPALDTGQKAFNYKSPLTSAIEVVDKNSKALLPTEVVMEIAGLDLGEEDQAHIARVLSRDFSFPPLYLFHGVKAEDLVNPVTGEPLTIRELRTMSYQFRPVAIAQMLESVSTIPTGKGRGGAGVDRRDPVKVGKLAHALAQAYPNMPASFGIATAVKLYDAGITPKRLLEAANSVRQYLIASGMPDTPEAFAPLVVAALGPGGRVRNEEELVRQLYGRSGTLANERMAQLFEARRIFNDGTLKQQALDTAPDQRTEAQNTALSYATDADIQAAIKNTSEEYGDAMRAYNPTLWGEIKEIESQVELRDEAFANAWYGKLLHDIDHGADTLQQWGYELLTQAETPIILAERFIRAPLDSNIDVGTLWHDVYKEKADIFRRLDESRRKFGTPLITYAWGVQDEWWAPGVEFFMAWTTDPLNIVGKGMSLRNSLRVVPGLLDRPTLGVSLATRALSRVDDERLVARWAVLGRAADDFNEWRNVKYAERVKKFAYSKDIDWLWAAAKRPEVFNARVRSFKGVYESHGLDQEFMSILRDAILEKYGSFDDPRALSDFRQGVMAHLNGGWAPVGTASNVAIARRFALNEEVERQVAALANNWLGDPNAEYKMRQLAARSEELEGPILRGRLEIPSVTRRGKIKARNVETSSTSKVRVELNLNPGRTFNIEDNPSQYVRYNMERAGIPEEVIGDFEQRMARAVTSQKGREAKAFKIIEEMNEAILDSELRRALKNGTITEGAREEVRKAILEPFHREMRPPKQAFAVIPAELDTTIPRVITDLNGKQRAAVRKTLLEQAKDSEVWKNLSEGERKIINKQLKNWVTGKARPTQEEWTEIYQAREALTNHLSVLAQWEDDIRDTVNHSLLTGEERLQEVADRWGPDFAARVSSDLSGGRWVGRYADAAPPSGVVDDVVRTAAQKAVDEGRVIYGGEDQDIVRRLGLVTEEMTMDEWMAHVAQEARTHRARYAREYEAQLFDDAGNMTEAGRIHYENVWYNQWDRANHPGGALSGDNFPLPRRTVGSTKLDAPTPVRAAPANVPGEDVEKLVKAIIEHEPNGGVLKMALENPGRVLWNKDGALAILVEELRAVLGKDMLPIALKDAETTRDILKNVKEILKWDDPFPLHPFQIAQRMGVDVDLLDDADLRLAMRVPETRARETPLTPSQLRNTATIPDPIDIRRQVREYIGSTRMAELSLGKELEIASGAGPKGVATWATRAQANLEDAGRGYRRLFKFGALAVSPFKYTLKVTLGDNNFRFLFIRGLQERLLSQRVFGRLAESTGLFNTKITNAAGEIIADVPPSGSIRYAREPLAGNHLRMAELTDEAARDAARGAGRIEGYGELRAGDAQHTGAWVHELQQTLAGTEPGTIVLEGIRNGDSFDDVAKRVGDWGRGPGYDSLRTRLGVKKAEVQQWADDMTAAGFYYTKGSPEIANAALVRTSPKRLGKNLERLVPPEERPVVNGVITGRMARESAFTRYVNWSYRTWVSGPDDALIRQPVFRSYKRGAELAYRRDVARQGLELTPQVERVIDRASTRFGLDNVNRTMFDATKQNRFMEHMGVFFPFPQPFFENFTAWAHIMAKRSPSTISHMRQLWTLGKNTGLIQQDENGEWIIPWHPMQPIAHLFGLLNDDQRMVMRASAFNMATQSAVDVFGTPIPAPGLDPAWTRLFQNLLSDSTNDSVVSYLFAYGAKAPFLPSSASAVLEIFDPERFNEDRLNNLKLWVMRDMQYKGLDRDENGNPLPIRVLDEMATRTARNIARGESAAALIGPTTAQIEWGFQPLLDELNEMRDNLGYTEGTQAFNEKYDYKYTLLTVGTTEYVDPYLERELGVEVPRIPASEFVAKLQQQPHAKEFLQTYPAWFTLLLVGVDSEVVNDYNPTYYSRQVAQDFINPKAFYDFVSEGQESQAWESYMEWRDGPYAALYDRWIASGGNTDSYDYTQLVAMRQDKLTDMSVHFPLWADKYLQNIDENGTMDFAYGDPDSMPKEALFIQARGILAREDLRGVPGIEALRYYVTERDKIAKIMDKRGYSDIRQPSAEEDGLTARLENVRTTIEEKWPEASYLINSYFEGDLTHMSTEQLDTYRSPIGDSVHRFDSQYRDLRAEQDDYDFEYEYYGKLQQTQNFLNRAYVGIGGQPRRRAPLDKKVIETWWRTEYPPGSPKRREYMQALAFKEPVFMSAFDTHLLGIDLTRDSAQAVMDVAAARQEIARLEHEDVEYDVGDAYDAINEALGAEAKRLSKAGDDSLKQWIEATNRWGYGLEATGLTKQKGKAGAAWQDIYDALGAIQSWADANDIHGTAYSQDYNWVRNELMRQIKSNYLDPQAKGYSKAFAEQWDAVNEGGRSVIQILMPDTYYRMG